MKFNILYTHYYDREGKNISVGGIQTYISALSGVLIENGYYVNIFQSADREFEIHNGNITIYGCKCSLKKAKTELLRRCKTCLDNDDIVIFGTDTLSAPVEVPSIAIQHGISWDVPNNCKSFLISYLKKTYKAWKRIKQISSADLLICVDYNFINWIRAVSPFCNVKMVAIPNFTPIPNTSFEKKKNSTIEIIFARRFFWYRGTRVFAEAIEKVLNEKKNIHVTFAGEGDDEQFLKEKFEKYDNVTFIRYESNESLKIHANKNIAVIPTVGSEGTSLSLLEAMASKCAVICTDVGGMTNIVINGYNGMMVGAGDVNQLYDALIKLIEDEDLRNQLSQNSFITVKEAFSYERWSAQWLEVVENIQKTKRGN